MTVLKYALFLGCKIPARLPAYAASTRAVLKHLGVTLVDLEFNCCGYPAHDVSRDAFVLSAARNLALAERAGLDLLTPCACCYGTLRQAIAFLVEDSELRSRVTQTLAAENLAWSGKVEVENVLTVLARVIGVHALAAAVRAPRTGLRVAAQYGCHTLRPSNVARIDNPLAPTIFETLIGLTGATPVDWSRRLDCCGDPLHGANTPLSENITRAKIADAASAGAQVLCTACPHCHLRLDGVQTDGVAPSIRPLLYTQLLGTALGLSAKSLGLE